MDVQGVQSEAQVVPNWIQNEHISCKSGFLQTALTLQPFPCSAGSKDPRINTNLHPQPGQLNYTYIYAQISDPADFSTIWHPKHGPLAPKGIPNDIISSLIFAPVGCLVSDGGSKCAMVAPRAPKTTKTHQKYTPKSQKTHKNMYVPQVQKGIKMYQNKSKCKLERSQNIDASEPPSIQLQEVGGRGVSL